MTNHDDAGHIPTTFPVDPNLTAFPIDSSNRLLEKIARLADLGETFCGARKKEDDWAEICALFTSIMDDAEMLKNLLNHYHKMRSNPTAGDGMPN